MVRFVNCTLMHAVVYCMVFIALVFLVRTQAAAQEPELKGNMVWYEHNSVPFFGYITDSSITEKALEIVGRYLADETQNEDIVRATLFSVFIDTELVSETKFVKPNGLLLPMEMMETFSQAELLDEGCNVGRFFSEDETQEREYSVWLIFSGKTEETDEIESCLLFAAAASAGIWLGEVPVMQTNDLRQFLDSMILGVR